MRGFREIIESTKAPSTSDLWIDNGVLKYFNDGWKTLGSKNSSKEIELTKEQFNQIILQQTVNIKADDMTSDFNTLVLKIENTYYCLQKKISSEEAVEFNSINMFDDEMIIIEAFMSKGVLSITANSKLINIIVPLKVGDSIEIKSYNLSMIKNKGLFLTKIDYGFGVGFFQSSTGGKIHIITSDGIFIFYDIKADGSIIKHSEKDLDNVMILPKGGNVGQVLKKTSSGYEWQNDNNTVYNAATKTTLGLVKAGTSIAALAEDADLATVKGTVNSIITQLKTAGILLS